jgi:hypothetical protein
MDRFEVFFLLGGSRMPGFVKGVLLALHASAPADPFWGYPPWLAVACLTLAAALVIWIAGKLLKWALWLLLIAVLVGGFGAVLWLLFH